jgi:NAD(P)-dependent dehydrogenase (short-subunit alcohol dehydrogenase family)
MGRVMEGEVGIVTGASRGIGAAAARAFAEAGAGAAVVLAARDEKALSAVAAEIVANGGQALAVPTDVGEPEGRREPGQADDGRVRPSRCSLQQRRRRRPSADAARRGSSAGL